jgi:predicted metal-dependent peptidase
MSDETLSTILAELDHLRCATECTLTVIQCDVVVNRVDTFEAYEPSAIDRAERNQKYVFHGRGGTDLRPPFNWVAEQVDRKNVRLDALIYFTDGFGPEPEKAPLYPVLWIVPPDGREVFPFGEVIRM